MLKGYFMLFYNAETTVFSPSNKGHPIVRHSSCRLSK